MGKGDLIRFENVANSFGGSFWIRDTYETDSGSCFLVRGDLIAGKVFILFLKEIINGLSYKMSWDLVTRDDMTKKEPYHFSSQELEKSNHSTNFEIMNWKQSGKHWKTMTTQLNLYKRLLLISGRNSKKTFPSTRIPLTKKQLLVSVS